MGQNPGSTIIPRGADAPRGTSRSKIIILVVEAVMALVVVGFVARALWASPAPAGEGTLAIPQKVAGFALQKSDAGPKAVEIFNRLHGVDVGTIGGWVGYYEGKSIIWMADTTGEARSAQLVDAMTRRIRAGNDTFGNLDSFRVGDLVIFTVTGQGQRHYYYQKGAKVVWIAAPNIAERAFLDDALKLID